MGSFRIVSKPAHCLLASYCFSFHDDDFKSKLTDDREPSQNSSVGKASDGRSEAPWFSPRFWHYAQLASTLSAQASSHEGNFPARE